MCCFKDLVMAFRQVRNNEERTLSKCDKATTATSARGVCRGPTHCCWATRPVTDRSTFTAHYWICMRHTHMTLLNMYETHTHTRHWQDTNRKPWDQSRTDPPSQHTTEYAWDTHTTLLNMYETHTHDTDRTLIRSHIYRSMLLQRPLWPLKMLCNDFLVVKVNCLSYDFNIIKCIWILRNIKK